MLLIFEVLAWVYVEVTQRNVIDTHQCFREIIALTLGVVLWTSTIEVGCSRFLPYLRECDLPFAATVLTFKYSRVSFCDVSLKDDSLLQHLSSRTEHSRLAVRHCRNSSFLSLLIALLSLFPCACVSFFFCFTAVFFLSWSWFFHPWRPSERNKRRKNQKSWRYSLSLCLLKHCLGLLQHNKKWFDWF